MEIILIIFLIIFLIGIISIICDSNRFIVKRYEFISPKVKEEFKFVFISDLHNKSYGKHNDKLVKAIDEINPDAIILAGDLIIAAPGKRFDTAIELLEILAGKYPIYYANGNHESRLECYPEIYGDMADRYESKLSEIGIKRINNDKKSIHGKNIIVSGLEIESQYYKRFVLQDMRSDYLEDTLGLHNNSKYEILIAHNPDYFDNYVEYGADLVLSGHVHGGVVRVPFLGGVISPSLHIFPKYDGGVFEKQNDKGESSFMILSRGLGMHTIPFRLFNPGELIEVTVRNH